SCRKPFRGTTSQPHSCDDATAPAALFAVVWLRPGLGTRGVIGVRPGCAVGVLLRVMQDDRDAVRRYAAAPGRTGSTRGVRCTPRRGRRAGGRLAAAVGGRVRRVCEAGSLRGSRSPRLRLGAKFRSETTRGGHAWVPAGAVVAS